MRRQTLARLAFAAGLTAALLAPTAVHAQKGDRVKFETIDGVELHGTWYGKDPKSTCVILLHNVGGSNPTSSKQDGWDRLAGKLNEKGFAVLSFDFRGHGDSTAISSDFWKVPHNAGVRGGPKSETINVKDFKQSYYPVLVNDIAAAKAFIDRRNDGGECNGRSIMLIGAQEGAVIGTMWLASEMQRYQLVSLRPLRMDTTPEGKYVNACVWLSMTGAQNSGELSSWLKSIGKDKRIPMAFVYGASDATASAFGQRWGKELKGTVMPTKKHTGNEAIAKTNLAGGKLLRKDLKTADWIVNYCSGLRSDITTADASKIEFDRKGYAWSSGGRPLIAKAPEEKLLHPVPLGMIGVRVP